MGSSVGWTISDDGGGSLGGGGGGGGGGGSGGGSRSALSFGNNTSAPGRHGDGGEKAAAQDVSPAAIMVSPPSISSSASERRSIYGLSRTYVELALCSSGRGVVPVRLGRSIARVLRKASPASRNGRKRPVPPRAGVGNTQGEAAARRDSPRAAAAVTVIPRVVRPHCFAPASPNPGRGAERATSCSTISTRDRHHRVDRGRTPSPPRGRSPCPSRPEIHVTGAPAKIADSDEDAGSVGGGCSRGRRCGTRPSCKRALASSGGVAVFEKCGRDEPYNSPVSPFSVPPSWAEVPPSVKLEPPGCPLPPSHNTGAVTGEGGGVESRWDGGDSCEGGVAVERSRFKSTGAQAHEREHRHPGTNDPDISADPTNGMAAPYSLSPLLEEGKTIGAATRSAENTPLLANTSKGQASHGWRWKRPSGDRGRRRRRGGTGVGATALSPSRKGGRPWGRATIKGAVRVRPGAADVDGGRRREMGIA